MPGDRFIDFALGRVDIAAETELTHSPIEAGRSVCRQRFYFQRDRLGLQLFTGAEEAARNSDLSRFDGDLPHFGGEERRAQLGDVVKASPGLPSILVLLGLAFTPEAAESWQLKVRLVEHI